MRVVGSTWYLFNRYYTGTPYTACGGAAGEHSGTEVRSSTNQGQTWSAPTIMVAPTGDSTVPWGCSATDGGVWYDSTNQRWHYMFQCLAPSTAWNGCELERASTSPVGSFSLTPTGGTNPVIHGGDLWHQICTSSTADCVTLEGGLTGTNNPIHDEGTWDIFKYDGTYYWLGFHGYNSPRGYRGIAKTTDFVNWIAGNTAQGVPNDAVFDKYDATNWRETWGTGGNIGAGAGSIVQDGSYYYQASEFADGDLGCSGGSKWDWGLFRSTSLSSTAWSQLPAGNPFLYSSSTGPLYCNTNYVSLFKDGTKTYLMAGHDSTSSSRDGIYLYRLDKNIDASSRPINLLTNSDFWRADTQDWTTYSTATITLSRNFDNSPDQSPYAELSCGASCAAGQSVYEDKTLPSGYAGQTFQFGGKVAVKGGGTGSVDVWLYQFDSTGALIGSGNGYTANVTGNYANVNGSVTLAANAASIRFQIFPDTTSTYCIDDLYMSRLASAPPVVDTSDVACS